MITKFTSNSNNFKKDLSNYKFTYVEQNNWITERTKAKYTYPIDLVLTPEEIVALKGLTQLNSTNRNSLINGTFEALGEVHEAVLEIEVFIGNKLQAQILYGLEEFPNFEKELSQLPLEVFDLTESIYNHAANIVTQSWPNVNYNFPKISTERVETDNEQWQFFEGFINNFRNNAFVTNDYDIENDLQLNKNIIQPMPYVMHIIKKGFEDAGYTLEGEILNDPEFTKMCEYNLADYYQAFNSWSDILTLSSNEHSYVTPNGTGTFLKTFTFTEPGRYKIAGNITYRSKFGNGDDHYSFGIKVDETVIYSFFNNVEYQFSEDYMEQTDIVDVNFNAFGPFTITLQTTQLVYAIENGQFVINPMIADFSLTQLTKFDENGIPEATLIEPTTINLTKSVPDMKFGDYVNAYLKWKNYGLDVNNNTVTINKIRNSIQQDSRKVNLSNFEIQYPEVKTNQGKSYELKFFEFESEGYDYKSIYINNEGASISPYVKKEDTEEIIIDAVPLPIESRNGVVTAFDFLEEETKSKVVYYDGLQNGDNTTQSLDQLLIPTTYETSYKEWFKFLLLSLSYTWIFEAPFEKLSNLRVKSIIYAYKQYHIIETLRRKVTADNSIEHEIETKTLE